MQKVLCRLIFCLACFIPSLILTADNQPMARITREEILFTKIPVVTASKKIQKSSEAPAAITVITDEQIKISGARTIAEAIQYVAGINVFGFQGANFRGVGSGGRILLLLDGRRNNDVFTGGFEIGFERSIEKVKRIEIIKGPASSLYGTNAFAGIINIITKSGADQQGVYGKAAAGNFSTQDYYLTYGRAAGGLDAYVSLYGHFDEGTDQIANNDATRDGDFFGKLSWKNFTFSGAYRPNRTEVPGIGGILTPESFIKRNDSFGLVQYQKQDGAKWTFFSQLGLQNELLFLNGRLLRNLDIADFRIEGEARANYKFSDRDDLTFGSELRHDHTRNEKVATTEIYSSANRSVFAENEHHLTQGLILSTGVRWDNNSIFQNSVNPRVGLIVHAPQDTILKFFAGTAFHGPEFLDLYTDVPVGGFLIQKNPLLKPEKVRSLEAEVSHAVSGSLRLRVNVYHNSLDDLITVTLKNFVATFANVGDASAYGLESGVEGKLSDNVDFAANHALQYAHDNVSNQDLTLVPRNTVNASISYHSLRGYRVGFYNKFVGSRPTINAITGNRITLDSYLKSDLILSFDLQERLELQAGIYNLFGVKYSSDFGTPQRGVQALAGISYRFK